MTFTVVRSGGALGGHGPIARSASIRLVVMAPEPALGLRSSSVGWPSWGSVLVAGSKWRVPGAAGRTCNGRSITWPCGVDVHSNATAGRPDNSKWPLSPDSAFGAFGSYKWQCVELVERFVNLAGLYHGIIPAPGGAAANMYSAADSRFFVKHPNGSGYRPVPGDIVVYAENPKVTGYDFGHIAVVESDDPATGKVTVLEQNVEDELGRGINQFHGKTLFPNPTWAGFRVRGFLHAKANSAAVSGPPIAIGVCGARGEGAPPSPGGICTILPDASRLQRVTRRASDSQPAWSPDHKQLAFVRSDAQGDTQIDVADADGTGLRQLTTGTSDSGPVWSPDGTQIAFSRNGQIALLDLASGAVTLLTAGPSDDDPSWSADGSLIAFASGTAPTEIDVMSAAGASRHTLVTAGDSRPGRHPAPTSRSRATPTQAATSRSSTGLPAGPSAASRAAQPMTRTRPRGRRMESRSHSAAEPRWRTPASGS